MQPDLILILRENSFIGEDAIHGIPDILFEVLSHPNHDLVRKKELYEKFAVKEYWIVDPDTKETTGFILQEGQYKDTIKLCGRIKSPLLNQEFMF